MRPSRRSFHFIPFAFAFVACVASSRSTYRLVAFDLLRVVVVVLIAADPATKVEVFADVANIIIVNRSYLAWRVVARRRRVCV